MSEIPAPKENNPDRMVWQFSATARCKPLQPPDHTHAKAAITAAIGGKESDNWVIWPEGDDELFMTFWCNDMTSTMVIKESVTRLYLAVEAAGLEDFQLVTAEIVSKERLDQARERHEIVQKMEVTYRVTNGYRELIADIQAAESEIVQFFEDNDQG